MRIGVAIQGMAERRPVGSRVFGGTEEELGRRTVGRSVLTCACLLAAIGAGIGCDFGERGRLKSEVSELQGQVAELRDALREANERIENAASAINDAKSLVDDCEAYNDAIDDIEEPETVEEP